MLLTILAINSLYYKINLLKEKKNLLIKKFMKYAGFILWQTYLPSKIE